MKQVNRCTKYMKPGYQYGNGECHLYEPGNNRSEANALRRCMEDKKHEDALKAKQQKRHPLRWLFEL